VVYHAPVTKADSYGTNGVLKIDAAHGLLANDSDPDGQSMSVALKDGPAHGTIKLSADGSFTYTPTAGFSGKDNFTYVASDEKNSSTPTNVAIDVTSKVAQVSGDGVTGVVDLTKFDAGSGVQYSAGSGNKVIEARAADVVIDLGSGSNKVHLGGGTDTIKFGSGISTVAAGSGAETFIFDDLVVGGRSSSGTANTILYFKGADGTSSHDTIIFENFEAGSHLQFRGYASPASHAMQSYDVVDSTGSIDASFMVAVQQHKDGTYHQLSSSDFFFV
jgi:hypothetical protein